MDKLDILNRDEFVDRLLKLIENISANKASTCFALNGAWGCGKSFVLDMLEDRLKPIQSPDTGSNKYFVIHYNCWKYDYYEEPLIAIVSTMISAVEDETMLFPNTKEKHEIVGMLKAAGISLLSLVNSAVKSKTGLDFMGAFKTVREGMADGDKEYEELHTYDVFFGFNQIMQGLKEELHKLSEDRTIVFVVDELDRCLPEYAVKVLERLHHLTEGSRNTITIVSVDKEKLTQSIGHLFAITQPEKYLEKFIRFEVKLGYGTVNSSFSEKYKDYYALFDKEIFPFDDSVEEFMQKVFEGIPIRIQEQLVERALVAHNLLFNEKKDYSFMCMELLLAVMICVYDNNLEIPVTINDPAYTNVFLQSKSANTPPFIGFFKEKFIELHLGTVQEWTTGKIQRTISGALTLYGAILYLWCWVHKENKEYVVFHPNARIASNKDDIRRFAETFMLIS